MYFKIFLIERNIRNITFSQIYNYFSQFLVRLVVFLTGWRANFPFAVWKNDFSSLYISFERSGTFQRFKFSFSRQLSRSFLMLVCVVCLLGEKWPALASLSRNNKHSSKAAQKWGEYKTRLLRCYCFKICFGCHLKTIENLPVCPGIYDPALVDMAERKRETNLYFVDAKGANVDGEIVKCIRSLNCTYKLPVHSKPRCNKCQDILRSCFRWKTKPSSAGIIWLFRKVCHSYHVVLFLTGCPPMTLTKSLKLIFPL